MRPAASMPPSPGSPLSPSAVIRPFPKTFTSSFPVQNPKIIASSYLKPFTDWRTTGTNKTLLGQPSLAVYKQDTKQDSHIAQISTETPARQEHPRRFAWPSPWVTQLRFINLPWSKPEEES